MRSFASTASNDLQLGADGNLAIVTGAPAVEVVARHHMQTRRAEMIHEMQSGIPFDITAWVGAPNLAQFEAAARIRLRQVPGVIEVVEFEASQQGDALTYRATLRTEFGEVSVSD